MNIPRHEWLGWVAAMVAAGSVLAACGTTTPIVTPLHALHSPSAAASFRAQGTVVLFEKEELELRSRNSTVSSWTLPWGTHVYEARSATTAVLEKGRCINLLATQGTTGAEALVAGNPVVFPAAGTACGGALPPGAILRGSRSVYSSIAGIATYQGEITDVTGESVSIMTRSGQTVRVDIPSDTLLTEISVVPRSSILRGTCIRAAVAAGGSQSLGSVTIVPPVPTCTAPTPVSTPAGGSSPSPSPS